MLEPPWPCSDERELWCWLLDRIRPIARRVLGTVDICADGVLVWTGVGAAPSTVKPSLDIPKSSTV